MSLESCPTDVVQAPAELVWSLLASPASLDTWIDGRLVSGPGRALQPDDRLRFRSGPLGLFEVEFLVHGVEAPLRLGLEVRLPLGVVNHQVVVVTSLAGGRCRVTYN
jgi:hypothetical protein